MTFDVQVGVQGSPPKEELVTMLGAEGTVRDTETGVPDWSVFVIGIEARPPGAIETMPGEEIV